MFSPVPDLCPHSVVGWIDIGMINSSDCFDRSPQWIEAHIFNLTVSKIPRDPKAIITFRSEVFNIQLNVSMRLILRQDLVDKIGERMIRCHGGSS